MLCPISYKRQYYNPMCVKEAFAIVSRNSILKSCGTLPLYDTKRAPVSNSLMVGT